MAEKQVIYNGPGLSLRGEKSRFVLPPAFRKTVAESSDGKTLCLAKHERWTCLTGFGLSRLPALHAKIERDEEKAIARGEPFDADVRRMQAFDFVELPFDASGRFVMPEYLAGLAKLGETVFFQGFGDHFTIWNPEELFRMGEGWEGPQAACRALMSEGGKGRKE